MFKIEGRLRRTEYFFLKTNSTLILIFAVWLVESLAVDAGKFFDDTVRLAVYAFGVPAYFIYDNFITTKRLHDLNKEGISFLYILIPFRNIIILFGLLFDKGTNGKNDFGEDPRTSDKNKFKGKIIFNLILLVALVFLISQVNASGI